MTSATEVTAPSSKLVGSRPTRKVHLSPPGAIEAAREMNVQYRTDCGRWEWPPAKSWIVLKVRDLHPNSCKTCVRIAIAKGQRARRVRR